MDEVKDILKYKLKKLIGTEKFATVEEEDFDYVLTAASNKIKSYCHRYDIPEGLYYCWADIALEIMKTTLAPLFVNDNVNSEEEMNKRITDVKVGDTTISLANGKKYETKDTGYAGLKDDEELLHGFTKILIQYRKVPGGVGDVYGGV